jgi:hypothetical protein
MEARIGRSRRVAGRCRLQDSAFGLPAPPKLAGHGIDQIGQQRSAAALPASAGKVL